METASIEQSIVSISAGIADLIEHMQKSQAALTQIQLKLENLYIELEAPLDNPNSPVL